jgi:CheY-like chemotaxis protein
VLLADPDVQAGKAIANTLVEWGLEPVLVHDGVEAMMTIQRILPRAVILDAGLPKMFGFQVCEFVKRNDSLRDTHVILIGSVYHQERYRRPATDLYGADAYLERPQLPEALRPVLTGFGFDLRGATPTPSAPMAHGAQVVMPGQARPTTTSHQAASLDPAHAAPGTAPAPPQAVAPPSPQPVSAPPVAPPVAPPAAEPIATTPAAPAPAAPAPAPAAPAPAAANDGATAAAERLARIIVSDIVLYNPEKFEAGIRDGNVVEALEAEIAEGRGLFQQRVDPSLREGRDFLADELVRVARMRGMK